MPNLKSLKVRIRSVKSTQKITKAMKMVSAAKLKRARENVEAATPYADKMAKVLINLANNIEKESAPQLLVGNGNNKKHLLVVVSSDRGLCGGLNTNLIKAVKKKIIELEGEGKEVRLFTIGKKGRELLSHFKHLIAYEVEGITRKKYIEYDAVVAQATKIIEMFYANQFDVCTVFYNKFVSAIAQTITLQQIIPLDVSSLVKAEESEKLDHKIYKYEPSEEEILNKLLPLNIEIQVYHALLENLASEHGARMTAMDNATNNAGDMIKKLTLVYNRSRQANITKELIEIISGAEAV